MSDRFIEIYLDEDVSIVVAELLRSRGFSAVTTLESGNLASSDLHQLEFASRSKKALLTHNRIDFERLAVNFFDKGKTHTGIIIAARRPPRQVVEKLLSLLNSQTAEEMKNQIIYI